MTNDVRETVEIYHNQFSFATTDEERERLSAAYKAFFDQLTIDEQALARNVSRPYLQKALAMVEQMEPMLQRAKEMLRRHEQQTA